MLAVLTLWTAGVAASAAVVLSPVDVTLDLPWGGGDQQPTPAPVDASQVNAAYADVAAARRAAAAHVDAELRAAVRVAPLVAGLRSPQTVDATLDEVPVVTELVARVDPDRGEPLLDALDESLDRAETAVAAVRGDVATGSWQDEFLAAQLDVVEALRTWNAASREVHDVVAQRWELWTELVAEAAVLDEDRWLYRTEEEAAGTWEIAVDDRLDDLATATAALEEAAAARDDAAAVVDAADAHAAAVFADRPTPSPTP